MSLRQCLLATALLASVSGLSACGGGGADPTTSSAVTTLFFDHPNSTYYVQDESDGYYEGVGISLLHMGDTVATVPTNAQGEALFGNLVPGDPYTVVIPLDSVSLSDATTDWFGDTPWFLAGSGAGGDEARDSDASIGESPPAGHVEVSFFAPAAGEVDESLGIGFSPLTKVKSAQ